MISLIMHQLFDLERTNSAQIGEGRVLRGAGMPHPGAAQRHPKFLGPLLMLCPYGLS